MQYLRARAAISSSIGLTPTPRLELAATVGSKDLCLGAEIGFDTASASFTKYNAGIGFDKKDFSASLILLVVIISFIIGKFLSLVLIYYLLSCCG